MKSLILVFMLAVTALTVNAQSYYSTNNLADSNHVVLNASAPIDTVKIVAWSTNTTAPTILKLYNGYIINTNTAYTNYTAARTAVVTTQINSSGSTNLYTNYVWKTTANAVAAANPAATPLAQLVIPAATFVSAGNYVPNLITLDIPHSFTRFLTVSNDLDGASFLLEYRNR
jgi:hypothetical protein